ncbi:MAG: sigma-70 family RNA polymerase sigma factor [Clostridium chrysemydis]|uniref:sigma-70 family RNA polymerase sigma factor n=1 Tax=Clostridium chrysemydis TaxID=2665504 RepID=UPI003F31D26F
MRHIEKVLIDYRKGDIDIDKALKECIPLIRATLMKRFNRFDEDLEQEAMIVAIKCLNDYSEDKKCTFSTYLCNNVKWAVGRYMWGDKLIRKPVYLFEKGIDTTDYEICSDNFKLNSSMNTKEGSIVDLVNYDDYLDKDFIDDFMLNSILDRLKDEHREILIIWSKGYTYKEIAEKYSISQSGAEQKVKRAIDIARRIVVQSEYKNEYKVSNEVKEIQHGKTKKGKNRKTKYSKELIDDIRERKLTLREISDKYVIDLKVVRNLDQRVKKGRI